MAGSTNGNGHTNGNGNGHTNGNGHGNGYRNGGTNSLGLGKGYAFVDETAFAEGIPPQNIEAEEGVIGGILRDNDVLHDVISTVSVADFYREIHQVIYRAIADLYDLGKPVDAITLSEEMTKRGQYAAIGGDATLYRIIGSVPHSANSKYYAQIVREKSISRQLIEAANEILREGYSKTLGAQELLQAAERRIFNISEKQTQGDTVEIRDVLFRAMERIGQRASENQPITGISSGLYEFDDLTGGFQSDQLIILAARPSMGKSALALNFCDHAAMECQIPTLFVSLEMGQLELAERLLGARSRIDGHKLRTGRGLGKNELKTLGDGYEELCKAASIFIDDTPARTMLQITANARRLKMRHDIGMIVVDYIQLIDSEQSRDSRQEQIAKISRRLKSLARELHVPVIALSQLNRGVENREDHRPRMADLRESGAIEQDADMVLLLHRPEYYDKADQPGIAELIIAKNRNGATETVKLAFMKSIMKFENLAKIAEPPIDRGQF